VASRLTGNRGNGAAGTAGLRRDRELLKGASVSLPQCGDIGSAGTLLALYPNYR
jgi:hypothetical protein